MVTIGSNAEAVHGPNATLTFDSDIFASVSDWTLRYGYKVLEEPVSNSNIPYFAASTYHGEFEGTAITTSDNNFLSKLTLSNGDLSTRTATLAYKDVSGTTGTTSLTGRWHEIGQVLRAGEFVKFSIKCVLSAVPTGF